MLKVGDTHATRRLHYCQGWGIRADSRELSVSRNVVRSELRGDNDGRYNQTEARKRRAIEGYWPILWKLLEAADRLDRALSGESGPA